MNMQSATLWTKLLLALLPLQILLHNEIYAKPLVAITQIVEHTALNETRRGIIEELQEQGFDESTIDIAYQNAQGNMATAMQIAQHLTSQNPAIFVAISTSSTQAAKRACSSKNIPIIFASVTDPFGSHFVHDLSHPESNITGVSNYVAVEQQLQYFLQLIPQLKRIGIIYNPSEANSDSLVKKTYNAAEQIPMQIHTAIAHRTSDVSAAVHSLLGKVDAIFINNDNTALAAFDTIAKICMENRIPLFCSDTDCIARKALAALGCSQYQLGRQAGKMAAAILNGRAVKDLPVQWPQVVESHINFEVAQMLRLKLPQEMLATSQTSKDLQ